MDFATILETARGLLSAIYCELVPEGLRPRRRMSQGNLHERALQHRDWVESESMRGKRLILYGRKLRGMNLSYYNLDRAVVRNCDLRGVRFAAMHENTKDMSLEEHEGKERAQKASLIGTDFSYSRLEHAVFFAPQWPLSRSDAATIVTGTRFIGCTGLYGAAGAYIGYGLFFDPVSPPVFQRWLPGSSVGDFPSWHFLSIFQQLRLLGFSNTLAIFLVAYAGVCKWYNLQLERLKSRLADLSLSDSLTAAVDQLYPLPIPEHFGELLLALLSAKLIGGEGDIRQAIR